MARCLDAEGGDACLLAKKLKEASAEIKKRKQRRKEKEAMAAARKAEEEAERGIHHSSPPAIDISTDEDDCEEEGVDEPQCTSASEEPVGDHKCPVQQEGQRDPPLAKCPGKAIRGKGSILGAPCDSLERDGRPVRRSRDSFTPYVSTQRLPARGL